MTTEQRELINQIEADVFTDDELNRLYEKILELISISQ